MFEENWLAAMYRADWAREKEVKEKKIVRRTWLLYSKSEWRLVKLGDGSQDHLTLTPAAEFRGHQDHPQFPQLTWRTQNSLRAVTFVVIGYSLLGRKATDLNQPREEMHRTESRKVLLRVSYCLIPMGPWTALTFPSNNVWPYCQPGKLTWALVSRVFIGAWLPRIGWPPRWLTQSAAPLELSSHGSKPHLFWCSSRPPGKQRHAYQIGHSYDLEITSQETRAKARPFFGYDWCFTTQAKMIVFFTYFRNMLQSHIYKLSLRSKLRKDLRLSSKILLTTQQNNLLLASLLVEKSLCLLNMGFWVSWSFSKKASYILSFSYLSP